KTTRVRCLGGEQIIISNTNLTSNKIRNFQKMEERRVIFKLGVEYGTSSDKLKDIPVIIKKIISNKKNTRFDRCNFATFGDFSLIFETVYYLLSNDYNEYMKTNEEINLEINDLFKEKTISFAFPTKTVHVIQQ
ncbi:MAG: mechanosensitive ion channel, partial [Oligoflexia bacterium]|nr:mechanosensitive ion channel [Oligoflexia bacterium]